MFLCFCLFINKAGRHNQCASHDKVTKFSHTCGRCSVQDKVQQNLDQFDHCRCQRSHRKRPDHDRHFTQIHLIKTRCNKRHRHLPEHQNSSYGRQHGNLHHGSDTCISRSSGLFRSLCCFSCCVVHFLQSPFFLKRKFPVRAGTDFGSLLA